MVIAARVTHKIDAEGKILGRLATDIAGLLRGKAKVGFTKHEDLGDIVTVINPGKVAVTGKKLTDKIYYRHSTYPGALKQRTLSEMLESHPEKVIILAVKNMLPKNRLAKNWLKRLKFEYTDGKN